MQYKVVLMINNKPFYISLNPITKGYSTTTIDIYAELFASRTEALIALKQHLKNMAKYGVTYDGKIVIVKGNFIEKVHDKLVSGLLNSCKLS